MGAVRRLVSVVCVGGQRCHGVGANIVKHIAICSSALGSIIWPSPLHAAAAQAVLSTRGAVQIGMRRPMM